jgi:hypothetical protein
MFLDAWARLPDKRFRVYRWTLSIVLETSESV